MAYRNAEGLETALVGLTVTASEAGAAYRKLIQQGHHAPRRAWMLQSASQTTSNAKRPGVAATTTATAIIVPTVIVQTPVCDNVGVL